MGSDVGWNGDPLVVSDVSDIKLEVVLNVGLLRECVLAAGEWSENELPDAALVKRARCFPASSTCFAALFISTLGIRVTIWNACRSCIME